MTHRLFATLCLGMLTLIGASAEATTPFAQGLQAEEELRIYEARDLFRQALQETPDAPGAAEHVAWFLFLNGFQDEECRDLLRQAAPNAQQPEAMERAARFIERKLDQRGPADEAEQEAQREFERAMIEQAAKGTDEQLGGALVDAGDFARGNTAAGKSPGGGSDERAARAPAGAGLCLGAATAGCGCRL